MAFAVKVAEFLLSSEICQGTTRGQLKSTPAFLLTARQYGEVVLPDASTGQGPGTLASKLSWCKEGEPAPQQRSGDEGALFAVMVQILLSITCVAVQV